MHSRKTTVEIDEQLLEAAQRILSTRTIRETIDAAFRELVRAQARRDEVSALTTMEGLDLANPEIMAGAWRA
jgi:Arc/MetJ family transcription regulator